MAVAFTSGTRTIPTHVGRTAIEAGSAGRRSDHPHARGENVAEAGPTNDGHRTIPTHVGRTLSINTASISKADHPHARGENFLKTLSRATVLGPSPRTWGERAPPRPGPERWRTIPTHVGRTSRPSPATDISSDHPHARGENARMVDPVTNKLGPSPRTWGERISIHKEVWGIRTIPTHVGRTVSHSVGVSRRTDHPHARGENSAFQKT